MKTLICARREADVVRLRRLFPEGDVYVTTFSRCPAIQVDRVVIFVPQIIRHSEAARRAYGVWRSWVPTRLNPEAFAAGDRIVEIEQ